MLGLISYDAGARRVSAGRETICGVPCLHLILPGDRRRSWRRALRYCAEAGVRRVLLPEGTQPPPAFRQGGLAEIAPQPLYRALAGDLALAALRRLGEAPERSAVLLRSDVPERVLAQTARALAPRVKQVIVDAPGAESLRRNLWVEFGMAGVQPGAAGFCPVELCFSGQPAGTGPLALCLGERESRLCGGILRPYPALPLPEGYTPERVLCALWQAGALPADRIRAEFP